jgi:hypothetical protein
MDELASRLKNRIQLSSDQGERFVTVLELPPVKDPYSAVKAAVVAEIKTKKQLASKPLTSYIFTIVWWQ